MFTFPNAEEICEQLIAYAGCSPPPTDLKAISSLWPNLKVSEENLEKEGYLVYLGAQGGELILRRDDYPNRKRFTFAHELGHWVLAHSRGGDIFSYKDAPAISSVHASRQTPEENWCNDFAGTLLMPTKQVHAYFNGIIKELPRKLSSGSTLFQVSEDAFLTRVAQHFGWIILFLHRGRALHRVGKRFLPSEVDRNQVDVLVAELSRQTENEHVHAYDEIHLPGFTAYGTTSSATRATSTHLFCLIPNNINCHPLQFIK